jgi:Uma2 family endonuclease
MEIVNLDLKKRYTFADYLGWLDDKRRELFNGFVKMMTPAPSTKHQLILGEIHGQFWQQLKSQKCKVFPAPFDVRFPSKEGDISDDKIYTVVQPDISIVCDNSKIDGKGCIGAPDLIVEIISPNTVKNDVEEKYRLYEQNAVKEYWIIHPNDETVSVFILENGKYQLQGIYSKSSKIKVSIFEQELLIDLTEVFSE